MLALSFAKTRPERSLGGAPARCAAEQVRARARAQMQGGLVQDELASAMAPASKVLVEVADAVSIAPGLCLTVAVRSPQRSLRYSSEKKTAQQRSSPHRASKEL